MGELTFFLGLQVKQKEDGIFVSQDKYVNEILNKFGFSDVKTARTPMNTQKALLKDADGEDVDEHLYRSMIGSLMYLTSSRPDIIFAVCACARFQVNPKVSHLHAVKRTFKYLKGQPKLGLWYPKDSSFDLVAYTDSDYAGASLDRKSTTGGCQFLGCRLILWQCKKQTVVANSTTEAEYIAASNCCGQYYVHSEEPLFFTLKDMHIEIRHHLLVFPKKKKIIQMIKIHTDQNVADLLTKTFDVSRFQYLIATAKDEIQVSVVGLTFYWHTLTTAGLIQAKQDLFYWDQQEKGIDYDEVFAPVARIKAIRLFLAYAPFKDFVVCQIDVKSAFLYGKIEEEVHVCQPLGFEDLDFPDRVYKVEKALYGLHQAPKAWYETLSTYLLDIGFQRGKIDKTLFIKRDKGDILLVQVYVDEHLYRSMIGSLMYLTSSRPDIMFVVCACARFQVNPKSSHLHAVKRIFRYLKGQPKLGLWYPKDSPFDLVAYTDSDYAGASLDRKSTTGSYQFLGCRLISWQCKKQTVTKIHIDNESTICIVKNPVFHSKTKHIEIRHHFITDSNEKKLIQMIKIHSDQNVADLLTKAFDVSRFQYLIASIGMLNA
ncbi:putative ribonuclease H-like domain-containing protein [Tanacetum coccineum]